jgi:hypothetical protein
MRSWHVFTALLAIASMGTGSASEPMPSNAVQVAGRVASFLQPAMSGTIIAAVIYQPGDAASEMEARAVERALGSGLVIGSLRLKSRLVAGNALEGLAGTRVAFVTKGTDYRAIAAAAAPRSILTISSDLACTRAGYCIVAINSVPRVQITVSKAATRAAKLRFSAGFLMLIKEI